MITIGVVSDTHGRLDRKVLRAFAGVDHILHAGDVGEEAVLAALRRIAPVTAVEGNCDYQICENEIEVVELGGAVILLTHVFDARAPREEVRAAIRREHPHAIVFGHTHVPCFERWGSTLLFNPGSASEGRAGRGCSVGILRVDGTGIGAEHVAL